LPSKENTNTHRNPQYLLKLTKPGHIFIQLEQTKRGHEPGRPQSKKSIAVLLLDLNGKRLGTGLFGGDLVKGSLPYINSDMVTVEIPRLEFKKEGYTIFCSTYRRGQECGMTLQVYSDVPFASDSLMSSDGGGGGGEAIQLVRMYAPEDVQKEHGKVFAVGK